MRSVKKNWIKICLARTGKLNKNLNSLIREGIGLIDCINQKISANNWMMNGPLINCAIIKSAFNWPISSGKLRIANQNNVPVSNNKHIIKNRWIIFRIGFMKLPNIKNWLGWWRVNFVGLKDKIGMKYKYAIYRYFPKKIIIIHILTNQVRIIFCCILNFRKLYFQFFCHFQRSKFYIILSVI